MAQPDKMSFQGLGVIFQVVTRSTATTPFLVLAFVSIIFSAWTGAYWLAGVVVFGILAIFGIALFVDDRKLRSENYNLAVKKMEQFSDKDSVKQIEGKEVYVQPILQTRQQQITGKARIVKKEEE